MKKSHALLVVAFMISLTFIALYYSRSTIRYVNAFSYGNWSVVFSLIEKGVDIDTSDSYGQTALHHACYDASFDVIKKLTEEGANYRKPDSNRHIPILIAAEYGRWDVVKYFLLQDDESGDYLLKMLFLNAVGQGEVDITSVLITKGASVNGYSRNGWTPLHLAIMSDYLEDDQKIMKEMVVLLIKNGADVNALSKPTYNTADSYIGRRPKPSPTQFKKPQTPLDLALSLGKSEIVSVLKRYEEN